mmetsp:Transcript_34682/g.68005  ORF Transcript_34682/g.68005 Transcript_34682/m.68005 type:complete len:201 (-) Transcript_34682:734-1336(-)
MSLIRGRLQRFQMGVIDGRQIPPTTISNRWVSSVPQHRDVETPVVVVHLHFGALHDVVGDKFIKDTKRVVSLPRVVEPEARCLLVTVHWLSTDDQGPRALDVLIANLKVHRRRFVEQLQVQRIAFRARKHPHLHTELVLQVDQSPRHVAVQNVLCHQRIRDLKVVAAPHSLPLSLAYPALKLKSGPFREEAVYVWITRHL